MKLINISSKYTTPGNLSFLLEVLKKFFKSFFLVNEGDCVKKPVIFYSKITEDNIHKELYNNDVVNQNFNMFDCGETDVEQVIDLLYYSECKLFVEDNEVVNLKLSEDKFLTSIKLKIDRTKSSKFDMFSGFLEIKSCQDFVTWKNNIQLPRGINISLCLNFNSLIHSLLMEMASSCITFGIIKFENVVVENIHLTDESIVNSRDVEVKKPISISCYDICVDSHWDNFRVYLPSSKLLKFIKKCNNSSDLESYCDLSEHWAASHCFFNESINSIIGDNLIFLHLRLSDETVLRTINYFVKNCGNLAYLRLECYPTLSKIDELKKKLREYSDIYTNFSIIWRELQGSYHEETGEYRYCFEINCARCTDFGTEQYFDYLYSSHDMVRKIDIMKTRRKKCAAKSARKNICLSE